MSMRRSSFYHRYGGFVTGLITIPQWTEPVDSRPLAGLSNLTGIPFT